MATVIQQASKAYQQRPKALGITVRRLQFHPEKSSGITLPIHLSCRICSLHFHRPFR